MAKNSVTAFGLGLRFDFEFSCLVIGISNYFLHTTLQLYIVRDWPQPICDPADVIKRPCLDTQHISHITYPNTNPKPNPISNPNTNPRPIINPNSNRNTQKLTKQISHMYTFSMFNIQSNKKILFYLINGCGTNIGNYDEKSAKRTRFRVLGGGFRRGRSCLLWLISQNQCKRGAQAKSNDHAQTRHLGGVTTGRGNLVGVRLCQNHGQKSDI